ncbi:hypothetical protein ANN_17459 [Periplaneta americana]|uniref:HAT C-terminal dimerisation domain-containing protein n=1 Tax=Periplaneta americana TaxID=6978 RepID=A0ABQ8ST08_PERAM|nr:hypothetical protein ANN_17459 [Periplaneta americana]
MFATTYVSEKLFSTMKIVKTKFRLRLIDKYLSLQLRLAFRFVVIPIQHYIQLYVRLTPNLFQNGDAKRQQRYVLTLYPLSHTGFEFRCRIESFSV